MFTTGFVFFAMGVVFLGLMLVLMKARRGEEADYRAMAGTPTMPIASVPGPGLVEITGQVVASDQGTILSPVTGRAVVTYRIDVSQRVQTSNGSQLRQVYNERDRREFWLDDGSGRRAWITPHEAGVVLPSVRFGGGQAAVVIGGTPTTAVAMNPQVEAWAMHRSGQRGTFIVEERAIAEGETLFVLGQAFFHDGVLVLRSQPPHHKLLMSTLTEAQLHALYATRAKTRSILLLICVALTGIGLLLMFFAFLF